MRVNIYICSLHVYININKNILMSFLYFFFNFSKSLKYIICRTSSWRSLRFLRRRSFVSKSYNMAGSNPSVPRRISDFSPRGQGSQSLLTQLSLVNVFILSVVDRQHVTHILILSEIKHCAHDPRLDNWDDL